jgi:hypothetical protein
MGHHPLPTQGYALVERSAMPPWVKHGDNKHGDDNHPHHPPVVPGHGPDDKGNGDHGDHGDHGDQGGNNDHGRHGGLGQAVVRNACPFAVHTNIVHGPRRGQWPPEEISGVLQPGETSTHPFSHDPNTGVSWKIWREDGANTAPVQLEYTWIADQRRTWYDLSMVDAGAPEWLQNAAETRSDDHEIVPDKDGYGDYQGSIGIKHAFADDGMTLTPQQHGKAAAQGNCVAVQCEPGARYCTGAYNTWNDWGQQHDCAEGVDLNLVLCG